MTEVPEWFLPKRYGVGVRWPISWQGWAITIAYVGLLGFGTLVLRRSWVGYFSMVVILTVAFAVIASRTTRGGWRWRWGTDD